MDEERKVHSPEFPQEVEAAVVSHPPAILHRPKFISAYDVAKLTAPRDPKAYSYSFGAGQEEVSKKLRQIADDIEKGGVVLQAFDVLESATRDDYTMTVVNVTFHRKT
jgi:hypothetical protein